MARRVTVGFTALFFAILSTGPCCTRAAATAPAKQTEQEPVTESLLEKAAKLLAAAGIASGGNKASPKASKEKEPESAPAPAPAPSPAPDDVSELEPDESLNAVVEAPAEIAAYPHLYETGWYVAGCYADKADDRDLPIGPFNIEGGDPYATCADYCIEKGNRYAGIQLSPYESSKVECRCGLTVGRYGASTACTVRCPGASAGAVCGNKHVNTVLYAYRVRRSTFTDMHLGAAAIVILLLLVANTACMTAAAVFLILKAKKIL